MGQKARQFPTAAQRQEERDLIINDFAVQHGKRLICGDQREVRVEYGQVICTSGLEKFLGVAGCDSAWSRDAARSLRWSRSRA